jgi:hypothetical protein
MANISHINTNELHFYRAQLRYAQFTKNKLMRAVRVVKLIRVKLTNILAAF